MQYYRNSSFNRISNLLFLWRKFYETTDFLEIFVAFEDADKGNGEKLKTISSSKKFSFLAFLAEVVSFAEIAGVDKRKAIRLFHWHFYYVFKNHKTYSDFWLNAGGEEERASHSWKNDTAFAQECEKYMLDNKIV